METSTDPYILYGFLAFIAVMVSVTAGAVIRLSFVVGRQNGQLTSLQTQVEKNSQDIADLRQDIADVRVEIAGRAESTQGQIAALSESTQRQIAALSESTQRQIAALSERVIEVRTLIFGMNERINMLMRHRHDSRGQVYVVPEETPSD